MPENKQMCKTTTSKMLRRSLVIKGELALNDCDGHTWLSTWQDLESSSKR